MFLKRTLISALAAVCALSLLIPAAYAHGCHRGARQAQPARCGVCTVDGCELSGRHTHGRTVCCGYDHEGGWCDGSCAPLCDVEGCTLTGRHSHGGTVYCGSSHAGGFCDGSCSAYRPSSRGHHGAHH